MVDNRELCAAFHVYWMGPDRIAKWVKTNTIYVMRCPMSEMTWVLRNSIFPFVFFFISFHLSILLDFSDIHWKLIEHFVWLRDWIYYVVLLLCSNLTCWCSTQRIEWLTLFWKKKFLFFLQKSWELLTLSHAVNFSTFLVFIRNKIWNLRWTRWDRDYRSSLGIRVFHSRSNQFHRSVIALFVSSDLMNFFQNSQ